MSFVANFIAFLAVKEFRKLYSQLHLARFLDTVYMLWPCLSICLFVTSLALKLMTKLQWSFHPNVSAKYTGQENLRLSTNIWLYQTMFLWQLLSWIVHSSLDRYARTALMLVTSGQWCRPTQSVIQHVVITPPDWHKVHYLHTWLLLCTCFISRESQTTRNVYWSRAWPPICACLSLAAFPHYCTDDVTWRNGRGCPLVVHYWADLQSVHGFRCYDNIARTRNVSECLYSLCACLFHWYCSFASLFIQSVFVQLYSRSLQTSICQLTQSVVHSLCELSFLLGEEAEASPSIADTLWRV